MKKGINARFVPDRIERVVYIPEPEPAPAWNPGIAAALSFMTPGLGQIYKGRVLSGLAWFVLTTIGYFMLIVPGLILHLICIVAATEGDPRK